MLPWYYVLKRWVYTFVWFRRCSVLQYSQVGLYELFVRVRVGGPLHGMYLYLSVLNVTRRTSCAFCGCFQNGTGVSNLQRRILATAQASKDIYNLHMPVSGLVLQLAPTCSYSSLPFPSPTHTQFGQRTIIISNELPRQRSVRV